MAIPDLINELKSHLEMRKFSLVLLSVLVGKPLTLKKNACSRAESLRLG